jgi:predicted type IV restriction endonuclease
MANVPKAVSKRLSSEVTKFKKILESARDRDVNESDTVTIITDMLNDVFGFDKYSDITREFVIQGTYCDLAVKNAGKVEYLIEVKAIGLDLKDNHLRQAINYAAKSGIKWVVLTNGILWKIYRVLVDGQVSHELVIEMNFLEINPRKTEDQECLFLLCKRGVDKDLIEELYEHRQSVNRYSVAALLLSDSVISVVKRELKKIKPGLKVTDDEVKKTIETEVFKRDLFDGEAARDARAKIARILGKQARPKKKKTKSNYVEPDTTTVIEKGADFL